jgi:hypothetical protein
MLHKLQKRREELIELLKQTTMQVEQLRGALALCDELIKEANGYDLPTSSSNERKDGELVG